MPVKRPFLLYLRSRLNLGLSIAAGVLALLSLVFLRPFALVPVLVIVTAYAALTGALFYSRRGAREVVAENEEDRLRQTREKIQGYAAIREKISVLRIGDERVSRALEYFLQESGAYLEKCREMATYSPAANERIERVMEICQVYLGEKDEDATSRRYGLQGGPPAQKDAVPPDPAEGFARDIVECANVIRGRITEDLLGQAGEERLAIMKELDQNK